LKADVLDLNPKAVVLLIGTNDIGLGGNPEDAADNIKAILLAIRNSNPNMPIIVCKVMPRSDQNQHPADRIKRLNALVEDSVKSRPNFVECDTWSIYADANGDCSKDSFPDLLHPNAAGYAKWAAALKPIFAKLNLGAEKN
jgi:lysophospholipase L1-like esterase